MPVPLPSFVMKQRPDPSVITDAPHAGAATTAFRALLLPTVVAIAACVPLPTQRYVADVPGGKLLYSTCAFNSHVPTGVSLNIQDIELLVSLARHEGRDFIEVRFDIPEGKTLQLPEPTAKVETSASATYAQVRFPAVSLVDAPILNNASAVPAVQQDQLPPTALLVGQRVMAGGAAFSKHFWLATYIDTGDAEDVWVTLAAPLVDGSARPVPRIHFRRQSMTVVALFNC